jgi:hypothetical protein
MNKNIEKIERHLKGVTLPEHVSEQHRRQLRRQILNRIERGQIMSVKVRSWKYAAVIALICTGIVGATLVGIKIHNYRVVDKNPERGYMLVSEDGRTATNVTADVSPEQAIEIAEETALLRQHGKRKLVGVVEVEVNGQLDNRTLSFEYNLSDSRTRKVGERDPYADYPRTLSREQKEEMDQLWHEQLDTTEPDKFITTEERQVYGSVFFFRKWKLVLSDGTEVTYSIGSPSEEHQDTIRTVERDPKEAEQILKESREIANLRQRDKRKLIAVKELVANSELDIRVFVYQYKLSDGRTRDIGEGGELNHILNKEQRQEWHNLKKEGPGEDLGTYEQKVKDRLFVFKRQRFILSDGTEVIWSVGTPKDGQ